MANTMEPTQMTDSLARMDWQGSTSLGRGCVLVAVWKRSMLRAHRLKVVTPNEVTWLWREEGGRVDVNHIRGGVDGELI